MHVASPLPLLRGCAPGSPTVALSSLTAGPVSEASDETGAARERTVGEQRDRARRDKEQRQDFLGVGPGADSTAVIQRAERRAEPGSRAVEREQARGEAGRQVEANRREFRDALQCARARGPAPAQAAAGASEATQGEAAETAPPAMPRAGGDTAKPSAAADNPPSAPTAAMPGAAAALAGRVDCARPPVREAAAPIPLQPASSPTALQSDRNAAAASVASPAAVLEVAPSAARPATSDARPRAESPLEALSASRARPRPAVSVKQQVAAEKTPSAESENRVNIERIVRVLRQQIGRERSQTTLRLDPPELGTIKLHLDLRQDALALRVDTQTPLAQRLLSEHLDSLRDALSQAGVQLERVEIRPPPQPFEPPAQGQHGGGQQQGSSDPPGHEADDGDRSDRRPPSRSGDVPRGASSSKSEPAAESLVNVVA